MLLVCGKMSRACLNVDDVSGYLREEETTCENQSFRYGLRYINRCGSEIDSHTAVQSVHVFSFVVAKIIVKYVQIILKQ